MLEQLPIEASADGKRNAYIHHCDALNQRRSYAVCLHLCSERKKGRLSITYSDCSAIIGKKACPALKMRKHEIEQGHAVYFQERNIVVTGFLNKAKEFVGNVVSIASAKKPEQKPKKESLIDQINSGARGTYADAITSAVAAEAEAKKQPPEPLPVTKSEPLPGESLLDMARRLMGK